MKRLLYLSYKYNADGSLIDPYREDATPFKFINEGFFSSALGVIYPLRYMLKSFIDTFKPYKGSYQVQRDYLQLFRGVAILIIGVFTLLLHPLMLLREGIKTLFHPIDNMSSFLRELIVRPFIMAAMVLRGVTQVVTFPLALLRIPFRKLITTFTGVPLIENNPGIKALVNKGIKAEKLNKSTQLIDRALSEKVAKSFQQGQDSAMVKNQSYKNYSYKDFVVAKPLAARVNAAPEYYQADQFDYSSPPPPYCP